MKLIIYIIGLSIFCLFVGCENKNDTKYIYNQSFEEINDWIDNPISVLDTTVSHTGFYSCKVDSAHPYSLSFHKNVNSLKAKGYSKVQIAAWIRRSRKEDECVLVGSIETTEKALLWVGCETPNKTLPPAIWQEYTVQFTIPDSLNENILKVYLWNKNVSTTHIDDISIIFQ